MNLTISYGVEMLLQYWRTFSLDQLHVKVIKPVDQYTEDAMFFKTVSLWHIQGRCSAASNTGCLVPC
jgi:hypothetical protein